MYLKDHCSLPPSGFTPTETCTSVWIFGLDLQKNWLYIHVFFLEIGYPKISWVIIIFPLEMTIN